MPSQLNVVAFDSRTTGNANSESTAHTIAMFAFNCGVLVFVGGAPLGPPLIITGLLIIFAASWMLIPTQHSAQPDDDDLGPAWQVVWQPQRARIRTNTKCASKTRTRAVQFRALARGRLLAVMSEQDVANDGIRDRR